MLLSAAVLFFALAGVLMPQIRSAAKRHRRGRSLRLGAIAHALFAAGIVTRWYGFLYPRVLMPSPGSNDCNYGFGAGADAVCVHRVPAFPPTH